MAKETKKGKKTTALNRGARLRVLKGTAQRIGQVATRALLVLWGWSWMIALAAAVWLAVSLYTYSTNDPSFSVSTHANPQNACGLMGAWAADAMFRFFGHAAWAVVLGCIVMAVFAGRIHLLLKHGEDPERLNPPRVSQFFGFVTLVVGSACLEALSFKRFAETLPDVAGGISGFALSSNVRLLIGYPLAVVLFIVMTFVGLSLLFDFSWVSVCERIGRFIDKRLLRRFRKTEDVTVTPAEEGKVDALKVNFKTDDSTHLHPVREPVVASPNALKPVAPMEPLFKDPVPGRVCPSVDGRLSIETLDDPVPPAGINSQEDLELMSRTIISKLKNFNIDVMVKGANTGPVITQYLIEPAPGVKCAQIENVADDLRRSLGVQSVRIVPVVPGTSYVGIEIPNPVRDMVRLKEVLASPSYTQRTDWLLPMSLGKDIAGQPVIADLAKMPHLMVAGTTGSGKSVGINSMILSMLHHCTPEDLRLVLIDPKMLEFSPYNGIPHLLTPVVTDMNKASMALKWLSREMDRRYEILSRVGVRHFLTYNERVRAAEARGEPLRLPNPDGQTASDPLETWPYIVCIIDELADLMLTNRKEVEGEITRIAQKARAAGIHLILATQRPSSDVVTSLIKSNVNVRIAFQVASAIDSRIIINNTGAQSLLGNGDMLYKPKSSEMLQRIQGCFVSDDEVLRAVDSLREYAAPEYVEGVTDEPQESDVGGSVGNRRAGEEDPLYDKAVNLILTEKRPTISFVQRNLGIGYNRAANLLEAMEAAGLVSKANAAGKREILVATREY